MLNSKDYISGEAISKQLGISRTAVWKHIKALKDDGHIIEAHYGKGYLLAKLSDFLTPEKMKIGLECQVFASEMLHFVETSSTNEEVKKLGEKGFPEGAVVIAEQQIGGKGRLGRSWSSPNGGIWFSILLRPTIPPWKASQLSLLAAAALQQTLLKEYKLASRIKWPNDLLVEGKKICGILTEMKGEMDKVNYVIMGIGINANLQEYDFSPELRQGVTSLQMILGEKVDRVRLLQKYLLSLEQYYFDYLANGFKKTREICKRWSYTLSKAVTLYDNGKKINGKAVDIGEDGSLIVNVQGNLLSFYGGEVSTQETQ